MKLGLLGGGNMAAALLGGLRSRADVQFRIAETDPGRRAELARLFGIEAEAAASAGWGGLDLIVLAVKPNQMRAACEALRPCLGAGQLLLSIAAGLPAAAIAAWSGSAAVVRAMPNTPALIGAGITGLTALPAVTPAQRERAQSVMAAVGEVAWFDDEGMLDAVTAISGSGPAYVFYFIEALSAAATSMGMDQALARRFAVTTFTGAAQLAARSDEPLELLRERVTSKGGTTAAALAQLQAHGVAAAIATAAQAARARSVELAAEYGGS